MCHCAAPNIKQQSTHASLCSIKTKTAFNSCVTVQHQTSNSSQFMCHCAAPTPGDGFVIFLDSDRHVKGPFVPAIIQSAREVYLRNLEKSAVSNTAYLNFLSMVRDHEVMQTCQYMAITEGKLEHPSE
eukprot:247965-Pelagomonas_calceolata.AAC.3